MFDWTLTEAADALRDGFVSSEDLTRACLDRCSALQPHLNAFIAIEAEAALDQARACDAARRAGAPRGPLQGVPLAHKDMFDRAGRITACGSRIRAGHIAAKTATVMARLEAAGAVALGRLNMSEFAMGPTGHNAHYGRVNNPWDPARITGGSSSGSGVAVAAGLAFGALGSDTGGSIRLPAAICGIAGLKGTQGRVSRAGAMPLSFSQDCIGPLARSAADVAVLYGIIAGPDPGDPTAALIEVEHPQPRSDLEGLRIGVATRFFDAGLDPGVAAALAASRRLLADLGAEIVEVDLPDFGDICEWANIVAMTEAATIHLDGLRDRPQDYGPQVRARLMQGLAIPGVAYLRALQMRAVLLRELLATRFADCAALHAPVMPIETPTSAEVDIGAGPGMADMIDRMTRFTRPFSFLGLPVLTLPIGCGGTPMPIGVQLVGQPFGEAMLLRVGLAHEAAAGSILRPSKIRVPGGDAVHR